MESENASYNIGLKTLPKGVTPCVLYLSSPTHRKVGKGTLYNTSGEVLHNTPIPAGHVKVSHVNALELNAPLPISDNDADMRFLGEAVGSYVAWPTHLVALYKILKKPKGNDKKIPRNESITSPEKIQSNKQPAQQNKSGKPQQLEGNKADKLQKLEGNKAAKVAAKKLDREKSIAAAPKISQPCLAKYGACLDIQVKRNMGSNDDSRIITMNKAIFRDEYEEFLEKEHIYELLNHKELSATVISLYIRLSNRYSFLSPHKLSMCKLDLVNVKKYIVDMLLRNIEKDKLFYAPYNSGAHWVIFAINATSKVIYYLDPLHGNYNNHSDIKTMFDTALQVFRAQRGATVSNDIDCGYYVLRFMKEIVDRNQTIISEMYFDNSSPTYSEKDLIELKENWF